VGVFHVVYFNNSTRLLLCEESLRHRRHLVKVLLRQLLGCWTFLFTLKTPGMKTTVRCFADPASNGASAIAQQKHLRADLSAFPDVQFFRVEVVEMFSGLSWKT
jgi:hypothetical protein